MDMLAGFERIKGCLLLAGLVLDTLASVFYQGRTTGRQAERKERQDQINEQAANARQDARNLQLETARIDDDAVAERLKRYGVRGPGAGGRWIL
ncbi:hypothetical protein LMG26686_01365 [Achromobacter mucicolens]|uniref:hypothetical protein n=1 Tax=Achromobacter mucicolens TaxID=1389922 RepID=UPI001468559C|nr:hypothetical protein [Achromobacter mucicolens]CAB3839276.1 hypothetical protein LMG26686_01365 [Achromobacter mucicolens]